MELHGSKVTGGEEVVEDLPKHVAIEEIRKGVKLWRNPGNKFTVVRVHYSADPRKRTAQWRADARSGVPYAEWMREYEIVWSAFEGVPVYAESYSKRWHISQEPLDWVMELPMVRAWDFGLDTLGMACLFGQLLPDGRLFVYRELLASDTDIYTFAEAVRASSMEWFPGARRWFDIVDPSGFNRDARSRGKASYCSVLRDELKIRPIPGEKGVSERIKSVTQRLSGAVRGNPKLFVDAVGCPILVEGFDGGYHYPYAKDGQVKDQPMKNQHSHVHDALQAMCSRVERLDWENDGSSVNEPARPRYAFGGQR